MKLKIKSLYNDFKDDLYLSIFILVPLIIAVNQTNLFNIIVLITITIFFIVVLFKHHKKMVICCFIIILITSIPIIINEITYNLVKENFNEKVFDDKCEITNLIGKDNYQKITFQKGKMRFIGFLNQRQMSKKLMIGTKVKLKGVLKPAQKYFVDPDFNYQTYLKNQKIYGTIEIEKIEIIDSPFVFKILNIKNINLALSRLIDKFHPYESKDFLKTLILGNNELEPSLKSNLNAMGISHLFVVSGMHFSLLILLIDQLLKIKIFKNNKKKKIIKTIILLIYTMITNFTVSVVRCFLQNIIKMNNEKLELGKFNQFSLSFIVTIIFFPFNLFKTSFVLTYLISGGIILISDRLDTITGYLKKTVFLTIFINLLTLPIISNLNANLNLLVFLFNLLYLPLIAYLLFPLSFLTLILPFFHKIYYYFYLFFTKTIDYINQQTLFIKLNLILPSAPLFLIILYYLILFWLLKAYYHKKRKLKTFKFSLLLVIIVCVWNNLGFFRFQAECSFINVKVGDVTLISERFNQTNILIDTGKEDDILAFLKSKGVKKIDYLIISHPDSDHAGQISNIVNHFKVKRIVISEYDQKTKQMVKGFKNWMILRQNQKLKIGRIQIHCLGPVKDYGNENDNSLVFTLSLNDLSILFTGDISKRAELDLIKKYQIKVDILKVAHHGSKGSSSTEFIEKVKFKLAVAMNGYQNSYGFPDKVVIERFKQKELYNTINEGTLTIKIKN